MRSLFNNSFRRLLCLGLLLQFLSTPVFSQTVPAQNWQIKTNITGFLSNALALELERSLNNDYALTLQGGAIINVLDPQPSNVLEGYFVRIGMKRYLLQENREIGNTGLAIKAELHYSHWRDWYTDMRGSKGDRWENSIGALATVSYSHAWGKMFFIEPYLGLGYIPTWQNAIHFNDSPPYETTEVNWYKITSPERRSNYFSHFWITSDLVFSPGILVGLRF